MAGQAGSKLRGLVYMSGMVTFLGAMVCDFRPSEKKKQSQNLSLWTLYGPKARQWFLLLLGAISFMDPFG